MAAGPKLQPITPGSALIADTVMQNFQALVDFLRSIPANSLLQYKYTMTLSSAFPALVINTTTRSIQYHKVNFGASPEQIEITATIENAGLAGGDLVSVYWEKTTPANGNYPRNADVWVALGGTITYSAANTVVGADNVTDPTATRFAQRAVLTGAPPLADGDWVRCRVQTTGASSACAMVNSDITLKGALRS